MSVDYDIANFELSLIFDLDPENCIVIVDSWRHARAPHDGVRNPPVKIGLVSVEELGPLIGVVVGDFMCDFSLGAKPADPSDQQKDKQQEDCDRFFIRRFRTQSIVLWKD